MQEIFSSVSASLLDASTRAEWPKGICDLWLTTRLEMAGEGILFATVVFLALFTHNAALAGLAITTASNLTRAHSSLLINAVVSSFHHLFLAITAATRSVALSCVY